MMKTHRILCLLICGLFCGVGMAQEPEQVRTGFQGLWQERTGHSLHLDYGFFLDKWHIQNAKTCQPLRFDLDYQYDIPWKFKRLNFFVETGIGYMWNNSEETLSAERERYVNSLTYYRGFLHLSAGLKVYCTDWLYLSLGGGFNFAYAQVEEVKKAYPLSTIVYENNLLYTQSLGHFSWGGYSAASIVGLIRQFSISFGYRADHWSFGTRRFYGPLLRSRHTNWFITLGVGYHF